MRACRLIGTPASVIRNLLQRQGTGAIQLLMSVLGGHTDPTPVTPLTASFFSGCTLLLLLTNLSLRLSTMYYVVAVGNLRAPRHPIPENPVHHEAAQRTWLHG